MGRPPYTVEDFWSRVEKACSGCWLWMAGKNKKGYGYIKVAGRFWLAHRLSYHWFKGPILPGAMILHSCDVPFCVNPQHLWAGTKRENMQDMVAKGRSCFGRKNYQSTLTPAQVLEVFQKYNTGRFSVLSLASVYGISGPAVRAILMRKTYLDVTVPASLQQAARLQAKANQLRSKNNILEFNAQQRRA